jgi:predicted nucleotidyltransferase
MAHRFRSLPIRRPGPMGRPSMTPLDLPAKDAAALKALLDRQSGLRRVWVYGSRARGDARPGSDLDLVVDAPEWDLARLLRFEAALDDLLLPYTIDVIDERDLAMPSMMGLARSVERERVLFWTAGPMAA